MTIILLVLLVVTFLIIGVTLIFKGYLSIPGENTVVPVDEHEAVRKNLEAVREEEKGLKLQLDKLTIELEQAKGKLQAAAKTQGMIDDLRVREAECREQVRQLEERMSELTAQADAQAKEALQVIETLNTENETLKVQVEQFKDVDPAALAALTQENKDLKEQILAERERIVQLEREVGALKSSSDDLAKARESVDKLAQENLKLKQDLEGALAKAVQLEGDLRKVSQEAGESAPSAEVKAAAESAAGLKLEVEDLRRQLEENARHIRKLEEDLSAARRESAGLLKDKQSLEARFADAPRATDDKELSRIRRESEEEMIKAAARIENLQFENQSLSRKISGSEEELSRLRDLLRSVRESPAPRSLDDAKEMELRRMCQDLKSQIDLMNRTIEGLRQENHSLADRQRATPHPSGHPFDENRGDWAKEKQQLEQNLRQLKDFNTHLLEKEKLIQMELTKSRAKAMGLEKICEQFRLQVERSPRA